MATKTKFHYGYKKDSSDERDLKYQASDKTISNLPPQVDLRPEMPEVFTQYPLQSCTSNAIATAFQYELIKQKANVFTPSRLFIYYHEREIENTIDKDAGAKIRNGIKTIATYGVCPETMWPYEPKSFAVKPNDACYAEALKNKAVKYHRVSQDLVQIKSSLVEGFPVIVGIIAYSSIETTAVGTTGILNLPSATETKLGGHAVLVVGYDDTQSRFIVRNSWGTQWGIKGYFTLPYEYLTNPELSTDFWALTVVVDGE